MGIRKILKKISFFLLFLLFQFHHTLVSYSAEDPISKIFGQAAKILEQKVSSQTFGKFIDENNLFIDFQGLSYEYNFSKDKTFKVFQGVKETDSGTWEVKGFFSNAIKLKYTSGSELYLQFYQGFKKVSTLKNLNNQNDEQTDRELSYVNKAEAEIKRLNEIERIKQVEIEKKEKIRLAKLKAEQEKKERELREKQRELREKQRIEEEKKQAELEKIRLEEEKKKVELQQEEEKKKELEKAKIEVEKKKSDFFDKQTEYIIILSILLIVVLYFSFKLFFDIFDLTKLIKEPVKSLSFSNIKLNSNTLWHSIATLVAFVITVIMLIEETDKELRHVMNMYLSLYIFFYIDYFFMGKSLQSYKEIMITNTDSKVSDNSNNLEDEIIDDKPKIRKNKKKIGHEMISRIIIKFWRIKKIKI